MHYYKKNIGDYAKKAGRLSMLQHGSYTLLIDACYDREIFPTLEEAIDWTWASSKEEIEAVEFVLRKFFTLTDGVYIQSRIQQELEEYVAQKETNAINGKKGGRPSGKKINPTLTESVNSITQSVNLETEVKANESLNHKPLTTNQEPITNNQELITNKQITSITKNTAIAVSDQPNQFEEFWKAYPKKSDKAKSKLAYAKAIKKASHELIIQSLFNQKNGNQWGSVQYTPMATTWLNGERWEDDLIPSGGFSNGTNKQQSTGGSSYDRQLAAAEETIAIYC